MRRRILPLLLVLNLALAALLVWLWITPEGQLRNVRWLAPEPVRPTLVAAAAMPDFEIDNNRYIMTLERPLFTPTRRPPPLQAVAEAPAPDPLPDIRLLGVYGNMNAGGIIASIDGQVRRVRAGDSIGGWSIRELRSNEIVVGRGEEARTIALTRSNGTAPALADAAAPAGAPGAASSSAAPSAADANRQLELERVRTQVRSMNVLRARAGMPPLPEP